MDGGRRRQSHVVESRTGLLNLLGKFASNLIYVGGEDRRCTESAREGGRFSGMGGTRLGVANLENWRGGGGRKS